MKKTLYYKVKFGFKDDEFVSINQDEIRKAIYAQVNGGIVIFNGGSVSGNNIIAITPDLNRALGFNPTYKLTGEDYRAIGEGVIEEHRIALENAKLSVTDPHKDIKKLR